MKAALFVDVGLEMRDLESNERYFRWIFRLRGHLIDGVTKLVEISIGVGSRNSTHVALPNLRGRMRIHKKIFVNFASFFTAHNLLLYLPRA